MSNLQKIANWLDKHKQPKKAMEVFLEEARKTITPEMINQYFTSEQFETVAGEKKPIPQDKKGMIVIRSVVALIESFSPEKQEAFLKKLNSLPEEVVEQIKTNIAEKNKNSNAPKVSHVTPEECQEASPEQSIDQKTSGTQDYGRAHIERHEHAEEREKTPDELALEEMEMGPRPHYDD